MNIQNKQDLARYLEVKKAHDDAKFHTSELLKLFNVMSKEHQGAAIEGMTDALVKEHRFIQQEFFTAFQQVLRVYGKSGADARNIAAITWAKEASDLQINIPAIF